MLWQSFVSFLFLLTFIAANGSSNVDDIKVSDHILTTELLTNLTHYLELNTEYYTTIDAKLLKFVEQFKKAIDESIKELADDDDDKEVEVKRPEACADINNTTGVYQLYLEDFIEKPFYVYCQKDSEDESAWTVIQRREDGSINFNRDWADYKRGFGNIYGEFFLGLEKIYALTQNEWHELRIQIEDKEGKKVTAYYSGFAIENEDAQYILSMLGAYTGDAGDSLRQHVDMKFSTIDVDNDNDGTRDCAVIYQSGWWFNKCIESNLNGVYDEATKGIVWNKWHGFSSTYKSVNMAIRPVRN